MGKIIVYAILLLALSCSVAFAVDGCNSAPCANCHTLTLKEAGELLHDVGRVTKVEGSPVEGLWLIHLERDKRLGVVFMDFAKKNLIAGTVFPLAQNKGTGKPAVDNTRGAEVNVAAIPLGNSIVMGNPLGKNRMFVFTDPDCPFCAKMHGELKKLAAMDPDLAIYVKLTPLTIHPHAYDRARVILGAKGRALEMLDKAFSGAKLPDPGKEDSKQPVDDSLRFAASAGISVTPTLVLPDGRVMPGFRKAAALKELLARGK